MKRLIPLFFITLTTISWAQEASHCRSFAQSVCGELETLDHSMSRIDAGIEARFAQCYGNRSNNFLGLPKGPPDLKLKEPDLDKWAQSDPKGFLDSYSAPVIASYREFESSLIDVKAFKRFIDQIKTTMVYTIRSRADLDMYQKMDLILRLASTEVLLPSEYLNRSDRPFARLWGFYGACNPFGTNLNAYNENSHQRNEVVICPGLFLGAMVNLKKPEQVQCDQKLSDFSNLYFIVAHEIGHSLDGVTETSIDQFFEPLFACQLKKHPVEFKTTSSVSRNRELTSDFWAAQALAKFLGNHPKSSGLQLAKNNFQVFCLKPYRAELESESYNAKMSLKGGQLFGTSRIEAAFKDNPELQKVLGCTPYPEQSACGF